MRTNSILIIYTGGTIGMIKDPARNSLVPFDFNHVSEFVPELRRFGQQIDIVTFEPVCDSSNIEPELWAKLATCIYEKYDSYDGFVILHGTDTMSYTASALSFMLENLRKPIIFTGSQLPISTLRTDGRENLITSVEIAAANEHGRSIITEVCIFFEFKLYRANRTRKHNAEHFNAFRSNNYPVLAEAGILINFNYPAIHRPENDFKLKIHTHLDNSVAVLKIFPGINKAYIDAVLKIKDLKAVVLETFGTGNAPTHTWFLQCLRKAINNGLIVLNVTQCNAGGVDMTRYATGLELQRLGVVSGKDITTEAAITKLMFLLGKYPSKEDVIHFLSIPISGEMN